MNFDRFIPSPTSSSFEVGSLTIHYYALCILLGILAALGIARVRWRKAGAVPSELYDLAIYVIPAGIIGGRLYHVITTPELYFGSSGNFSDAFKIWDGGMGIWGAVALGTFVAWIYFKLKPRSITFVGALDALAPGILVAQAIGRWGNWFNIELFGKPSTLPWALRVPEIDRPVGFEKFSTFTPTFLYESIWCLICAAVIIYLPSIRKLKSGNTFLLYIVLYCIGRGWIETLRIDRAHHVLGLRLNVWVAVIVGMGSLAGLVYRQRPAQKV